MQFVKMRGERNWFWVLSNGWLYYESYWSFESY